MNLNDLKVKHHDNKNFIKFISDVPNCAEIIGDFGSVIIKYFKRDVFYLKKYSKFSSIEKFYEEILRTLDNSQLYEQKLEIFKCGNVKLEMQTYSVNENTFEIAKINKIISYDEIEKPVKSYYFSDKTGMYNIRNYVYESVAGTDLDRYPEFLFYKIGTIKDIQDEPKKKCYMKIDELKNFYLKNDLFSDFISNVPDCAEVENNLNDVTIRYFIGNTYYFKRFSDLHGFQRFYEEKSILNGEDTLLEKRFECYSDNKMKFLVESLSVIQDDKEVSKITKKETYDIYQVCNINEELIPTKNYYYEDGRGVYSIFPYTYNYVSSFNMDDNPEFCWFKIDLIKNMANESKKKVK